MKQAQQMMAAIGSSLATRPKGSGLFTRALRSSSASVIRLFRRHCDGGAARFGRG
jgi:hypothetical protein